MTAKDRYFLPRAILVYVAVSSLAAHFLAMIIGSLNVVIAVAALLGGLLAAFLAREKEAVAFSANRAERFLLALLLFFIMRYFLYLFYPAADEWRTLHPNNLGDLPLHLTYIRQIAGGASYPPENPFFAGENLLYPFAIDLHGALYEVIGWSTSEHLLALGGVLTWVTLALVFGYGHWAAVIGLFLNGGLFGWWFFFRDAEPGPAVWAWKDFITSLWITQRGLLWAVPAGIVLLVEARRILRDERHAFSPIACLFLAAMPFFHLHSFLFFAFFLAWCLAAGGRYRWRAYLPLLWSAPTAAYFVFRSTEGFGKASVIHWRRGWMAGGEGGLWFWLWNLGPWLAFFTWLFYELWRRLSTGAERTMAAGYLILGLLFSCLMFAPWNWDNIKLLIWPYLGLLLLAGPLWRNWSLARVWKDGLLVCLALGGLFSLSAQGHWRGDGVKLYDRAELNSLAGVLREVPADAVFAAWPTYSHPLSYFGYQLAVGYPGHLWSHGIDSRPRELLLRRIMTGGEDWRKLAAELGIDYLYWGARERTHFGGSPAWRSSLKNISTVDGIEIYATEN